MRLTSGVELELLAARPNFFLVSRRSARPLPTSFDRVLRRVNPLPHATNKRERKHSGQRKKKRSATFYIWLDQDAAFRSETPPSKFL
jgi:hypothetical protein